MWPWYIILFSGIIIISICDYKYKKNIEFLKFWSEHIIAFIAVLSLIFIMNEFNELTYQNSIMENDLRMTYAPLALFDVVKISFGEPEGNFVTSSQDRFEDQRKISDNERLFTIKNECTNIGDGVMLFIGCITFSSKSKILFDKKTLIKKIESMDIIFDGMPDENRLQPCMKDSIQVGSASTWRINQNDRENYLYSLVFYKDRDHNLYATLCLFYYRVSNDENPFFLENFTLDKLKELARTYSNQYFYNFTKEEQGKIYQIIKEVENNIGRPPSMSEAIF